MQRLSLVYPNGRSHELDYHDHERRFEPGDVFELYGREWRVVALTTPRSRHQGDAFTVVCRSMTASPLRRSEN